MFVGARVVGEILGNIGLDVAIIASATTRQNVGNAINGTSSHIVWVEIDLTHAVKIKIESEVGERFHFFQREAGAKIVTESGSDINEVSNGELFFKNFIFDADKDFLLASATAKVTTGGAMTSASKAKSLFAINSIGDARLEDGAGPIIIINSFVESNGDTA